MLSYLSKPALIYILTLTFFLGAFLGSGLHCLAYRMVRGQAWAKGRSQCPACGHVLGVLDLIPVFSWLLLRGRCRHCGSRIPLRYFLAEVTLGTVFLALLMRFGFGSQMLSTSVLCCCLFCLSLIDWERQIIPDRFLLIPGILRLIQLALEGGSSRLFAGLIPALLFGGGLLALGLVMDTILKRDSLGGGDIKLMALLGLYFSIPECLFLLLCACILAMLAVTAAGIRKGTPFPFGPALSTAAFLTLLFGEYITQWYLNLFFR